jgi:hypothetical protein
MKKVCFLFRVLLVAVCLPAGLLPAQKLIWDETFSNNNNNWTQDATMKVRNGRYEFYNTNADSSSWRTSPLRDGTIQADTLWLGDKDSQGYGLVFRLKDNRHFYFFWIAAQGYYIAGKVDGANVSTFFSWTKSPAIKVRGSNTMTVRTLGSKFTGSVNGTELFTVEDSGYAEGGYGFYTVKSVQAAFDNLKVWEDSAAQVSASGSHFGWLLVNVEKRVRFPDDGRTVQVSGKEGNLIIEHHYNPNDNSEFIRENWIWTRPPEWLPAEKPLSLTGRAIRLDKKGGNWVEMGMDIDYTCFEDDNPGAGGSAMFGESKTWDIQNQGRIEYEWFDRRTDGKLVIPRGYEGMDKLVIRAGGFTGPVEHYYFFYIYRWVP